jgi:SNF2 family DNA or RNA helicase
MILEARIPPYAHQEVGVQALVSHPFFALFDEMGAGKSKQVVDAALLLAVRNIINRVIIVCPAPVRSVWSDPELGELKKHLWYSVPSRVIEFHARRRQWDFGPLGDARLKWIVTNYDFIRRTDHLAQLLSVADKNTLLVLDESSAVKNSKAQQSKACMKLRLKCGRIVLLNGTPIANNPLDMYSQGNIMDPRILDCKYIQQFYARYAVQTPVMIGGRVLKTKWGGPVKTITGWTNIEDLQQRFAPYVLRRLKADCLDLPEKLPSVVITVPLTETTWSVYKQMRDEMVAWLSDTTVCAASQAIVKAMRLAQITSGFLGGLEDEVLDDEKQRIINVPAPLKTIGQEKLDAFLVWWKQQIEQDPNFKLLVWSRFRAEVDRLAASVTDATVGRLWGGQKPQERLDVLRLLDPRTAPAGPVLVVGVPKTGAFGLNLTAAHTVMYISNDYSLMVRAQSEDRVHRPGQRHVVSYYDVVATGPQGQKTVDHTVLKALVEKQNLATWTTSAWLAELRSGN